MEQAGWTIGVDLGGTKLDVGLVDASGKVIDRRLIKTKAKEGPKAILQDIIQATHNLISKHDEMPVLSVGVGIAGQIEMETGAVRFAPNLNWHDYPLQKELGTALKLPIYVMNDVRAAAYGEWLYGAGKGSDNLLCVFVGTGIGGGIVSDGNLLIGCSNVAGEIGHITIEVDGPSCTCGNHGCFESLASGWAIARLAKEAVLKDSKAGTHLLALVDQKTDYLTAEHVLGLSRKGDPLALSIVNQVSKALIAGISSLVNTLNPERVILGGGVIHGFPEFIDQIKEGVPNRTLKAAMEPLEISLALLKAEAGVVGAAAYSRDRHLLGVKK